MHGLPECIIVCNDHKLFEELVELVELRQPHLICNTMTNSYGGYVAHFEEERVLAK